MADSLWPAWKAAWALFLGQPSQKGFRALGKGLGEPVWDQKKSAISITLAGDNYVIESWLLISHVTI
jgi:hypothetical protein